jgi:hypothetical protein
MEQGTRHQVTVRGTDTSGYRLIECAHCGPLGVCERGVAQAVAKIHEVFGGVLIDALELDR